MNFAVGGTGGRTSTHICGVPTDPREPQLRRRSSKLAIIGETSLAVLPKGMWTN
jgi:hypothetical protein